MKYLVVNPKVEYQSGLLGTNMNMGILFDSLDQIKKYKKLALQDIPNDELEDATNEINDLEIYEVSDSFKTLSEYD